MNKKNIALLFGGASTEHIISCKSVMTFVNNIKSDGYITKEELGCALITRDNQEFQLKAQGWNPLQKEN